MPDIAAPSAVARLLASYGMHPKKSLGQNFLVDANILNKIVNAALLTPQISVLEIGPGLGSLTGRLAAKAGKVVALELDDRLIPILQDLLVEHNNVEIVHGDVLKTDLDSLMQGKKNSEKYKVVANLPYYITTPVIFKLLEECQGVSELVVMIQQEVAQRLTAKPGTKDYGILTIAVSYYCKAEFVTKVKRTVFFPRPEVDSAVVRLQILPAPGVKVKNKELYFKVVRGAFNQRRKTLVNALNASLNIENAAVASILTKMKIDQRIRGEALSPEQFAIITDHLDI